MGVRWVGGHERKNVLAAVLNEVAWVAIRFTISRRSSSFSCAVGAWGLWLYAVMFLSFLFDLGFKVLR